jgi:hypothetical protein
LNGPAGPGTAFVVEKTAAAHVCEPIVISLANGERFRALFDVSPSTWLDWPNGRGPGRVGYVIVREGRKWLQRRVA